MTHVRRPRSLLGVASLALLLAACGGPTPSPIVATTAPARVATAAPPATTAYSVAPSVVPTATPIPSLAAAGTEVFSPLQQGHWVVAASEDNLGETTQTSVLLPIGDTVEAHMACDGAGSLHVVVTAAAPATEPPNAAASTLAVVDAVVECPETDGESVIGAGTMPPGWFVSVQAEPSDPSILYQVLVGTIVD